MHDTFVHQHTAFRCEILLASVHVAHEWLGKSVRDAVLLCVMFRTKSLGAFVASERSFVGVLAVVMR
jgi:hypothetical protein